MRKSFIIIFLLHFFVINIFGINEISRADSAYMEGDYKRAIEIYSGVVQEQGVSASLLYNLGNAYLKDGDWGNAMLCYQRAKKLAPSNSQINSNLKYLKEKIEDANKAEQKGKRKKVEEDTPNFFQTIHSAIAEEQSSDMWAGWAAAFFILCMGCVALYLFIDNVFLRKVGFFGGIILLGLTMIFLVCGYSAAAESQKHEYGIIISYKVNLQTEPKEIADNASSEGTLTRGTKIRIVSEETDAEGVVIWYKVRLNSDYIGWVPANDLEII